jgi:hypothetical protein
LGRLLAILEPPWVDVNLSWGEAPAALALGWNPKDQTLEVEEAAFASVSHDLSAARAGLVGIDPTIQVQSREKIGATA